MSPKSILSSNKPKLSRAATWLAILAVVLGPQSFQPISPAAASKTTISDPGNNCHIEVTSETVVVDNTSVSVSLVGTRCLVKFLTTGSYSVTMPDGVVSLDYLVVGAGGGGGSGGGGAGGVLQGSNYEVNAGTNYVISVGAGGQGGSGGSGAAPIDATNGENSTFGTLTALGGGHGGQGNLHAGDGGSGGGSQFDCTSVDCAGSGTPGQGTDGAPSTHTSYGGGAGGGGAGGAGGNTVLSHIGGNGGTGVISSITGVPTYYGGGGGGGINSNDSQYCGLNSPGTSDQDYYCSEYLVTTGGGDGGLGGGGKGSSWGFTDGNYGEFANGTPGEPNTGGGGGGTDPEDAYAYAGGSGIVVLSYVSSASYRKITFDSNNGSGVTAEQNVESGAATELRSNPFTYDGYVFQGWNTQADGNGTNYGNRTTFTTTNGFTLYAQWAEGVDHTVTFDSNGGTGDQDSQVAGLPTVLDDNQFVRSGYTFTGWNTKRTGYGYSYSDNAFFAFDFDATLYAQWSLDKLTRSVNFYGNGATSGTTSSQIGSSTAPLNANGFQRTGYNFLGWHTSDRASWTEYLDLQNYSFEQDLSLYAIWVPQYTNTVYFDGNGASSGSMQNQDASSRTLLEPNGFVRDGFTFLNWNTIPDGTGVNYQSTYSYNFGQGVVLYAIWGQNFTVSYNGNGNTGGLKPDSQSAVVGGESLTLQSNSRNLSKTQYLLAGWNSSADGSGTRYALGQTKVSLSGDVTLYAQWVAEEVTVTYEYDGADGGNSTAIEFYTYGTSGLILPTPTKTDYTFRGWYSSSSLMRLLGYGGTSYTPPAYSLTNSIYAKWSPISEGPEQQTLEIYGGIIDEEHPINSPDPYTETSTDGGLTWHPAYLVGSDHPWGNVDGTNSWLNCGPSFFECLGVRSDYRYRFYLAPGWSASNLTASMIMDNYGWVTLNGTDLSGYQEGNWNSPGAIPVDQITHTGWNELYVVLVDQGGYAGINFHLTFNVTSPTPIKVLEPGTPNTLKVQFNLQGAPISYAAQTYTLGGDALLIPTPTRDGYSFMGWAKGSIHGAVVQPGSFTPDDNVTLYALWDAPSHTASFDSNGGSAVADVLFADDGGTVAKPKNPTRSGYRFLGWSANEGGNALSFPYTPGAAQDITLYALWSPYTYTVTYDSKQGSAIAADSFVTDGSLAIPYDPIRTNYSFLGWSATDGGSPITFPYTPSVKTNITLYALWSLDSYTVTFDSKGGSSVDPSSFLSGGTIATNGRLLDGFTPPANAQNPQTGLDLGVNVFTSQATWVEKVYFYKFEGNDTTHSARVWSADGTLLTSQEFLSETASGWQSVVLDNPVLIPENQFFTVSVWGANNPYSHSEFPDKTVGPITVIEGVYDFGPGNRFPSAGYDGLSFSIDFDFRADSAPTPPIREGYTFSGWSASDGGSAISFPYTPGVTQDITLYALWTADSHTVTYDSKGGSSVADGTFVTEGSVAIPYDPSREGYTFLGWSDTDGGQSITFPYTPGVTQDITLYALWTAENNSGTNAPMVLEQTTTYDNQIALVPLNGTVRDVSVDWGDGIIDGPFSNPIEAQHTYATPGTYTVKIYATELSRFGAYCRWNDTLTKVVSFGSIGITNLEYAFACSTGLRSVPSTLPEGVTNLTAAFYYSYNFNQDLTGWDTSAVTSFNNMFENAWAFNGDISTWDTGSAISMQRMFTGAGSFNKNISNWDTHSLIYMNSMFENSGFNNGSIANDSANPLRADGNKWNLANVVGLDAVFVNSPFNQDVGNWDVSNVTNFRATFGSARSFDQDLSDWDTSSGRYFHYMFYDDNFNNGGQPLVSSPNGWNLSNAAEIYAMFQSNRGFNQDISSWDITNVTNLNYMFYDASAFNNGGQPLTWDTSNIQSMESTFQYARAFNADISSWDMSNVISTQYMFFNATAFQSDISQWNVSKVTNMNVMFADTTFNGDIGAWNTSNVRYMHAMFSGNSAFDTSISNWNTSNVGDMSYMFRSTNFNQPLNDWDVGSVTNMSGMFQNAQRFNQPLADWDVTGAQYMSYMFQGTRAFSQPLTNWNMRNAVATDHMFYDSIFNADISNWNTSRVENMTSMFHSNPYFNQDISNWDVSNVRNFDAMFYYATKFNQPIGSWDVSSAVSTGNMFAGGIFNQPLNDWDVSKLQTTYNMFHNNIVFNQDLDNWNTANLTSSQSMFQGATNFNGDITTWDTSKITWAGYMFDSARSFNQDISNWDVSSMTNFEAMFLFATSFNQPIGKWNVSNMTSANQMFRAAIVFNQDLSSWDTGKLQSAWAMFFEAAQFNGNVSTWDTHSLQQMQYMFERSSKFNQDLSNWDFSNVYYADNAFNNSRLNKINYAKLLISLNNQNLRQFAIGFENIRYLDIAAAARANLTTSVENGGKGLNLYDGGQFSWFLVTVNKNPSAADIKVGQSLADSNLSGAETNVTGTWTFTDPTVVPTSEVQNVSVTFTPDDAENYEPPTIEISVRVLYEPRSIAFTGTNPAKWVKGSYDASATVSIGSGVVSYSILSGDCSIDANGQLTATASGTCSFKATVANDGTYESVSVDSSATLRTNLVTFDSKSGSAVESQQMDVSGSLAAPSEPTRAGYTFLGWSDSDGGASVVFPYAPEVTDDITLYALWSADSHDVTYNSNGGSSVVDGTFVTDGSLPIPFDPTRAGYAFLGWSDTDGGEAITFPYSPGVYEDITLYALWSVNTYVVNYNTKGGSPIEAGSFTTGGSLGSNSQILDGSVPPSQPMAVTGIELGLNLSTNQDGWVRKVSFFKYEGDEGGHSAQVWSADGRLLGSQEFDSETSSGWQTLTLTKPVFISAGESFTASVYGATYSYAYDYIPKTNSGPLSVIDGSFAFGEQSSYPSVPGSWSYGVDLDFMTASDVAPTLTGYTLAGWSATDGGALLDFPYSPGVTSDITLFAKWAADSHSVTFDSKSGSIVSAGSFVTDGSVTAPASPTRAGYTFLGWSATDGGAAIAFPYSPGVITGITLYAKWSIDSHIVTFNSKNGSAVSAGSFVTAGSVAAPSNTTRVGYNFLGWAATEGGSAITFPYSPGVTTDVTLYALWSAITVPSGPQNVTATAGNKAATVTWAAPANNGGGSIISYLVTASTGQTCSTVALTCTITGLLNKTAVTFTVVAINSSGNGAASTPSSSITPFDPNDDVLPPEGDGGSAPKEISNGGKFVVTNDSTLQLSWDKKNGKLISKATGIYTGYIEAKITFTKAGKAYSCSTVFGILKVMPQKTAAQKATAMKMKTFTGKQFCIDKIKMDAKSVAPKGGMTPANFKNIKSTNKTSVDLSSEKAALAALKNFTGLVEVTVVRYRAWPTTMLNRGDHTGKGGKIPALIRNTKVNLG